MQRHSFRDRLGYAIGTGEDAVTAASVAAAGVARLPLKIEPASVRAPAIAEGASSR